MARHQVTNVSTENQASVQEEMFRSLLQTPHRQVGDTIALHKAQYDRDPNFYAHLAVHAIMREGSAIRDVNEVFIATLFASEFPELREAAFVLMQSLPPYQVCRVIRHITGYKEVRAHRSFDPPIEGKVERMKGKDGKVLPAKTVKLTGPLRARLLKQKKVTPAMKEFTVEKMIVTHPGIGSRTIHDHSALMRAVRAYLRTREHPLRRDSLESGLLRAKSSFKTLYAKSHTLPGDSESSWINQYLFKGQVEEGSRLDALRKLSTTDDPTVQAELIVANKIPCPVAVTFLKNMTPSVIVAMINAMSPQELMANIKHLQKRGATDDPQVKALIADKLSKAKTAKKGRIDAMKSAFAASQVEGLDEDLAEIMTEVTDAQLKQHGTIRARTAMLIDKSASMSSAIKLATEIGAVLAQACESLRVFTFDYIPTEIALKGDMTTKSAWDKALQMVRANGGTEPDKVVQKMILEDIRVDQFLLLTDEGENTRGAFAKSVKRYEEKMGYAPNIVIVRLGRPGAYPYGACDYIEKTCKADGLNVDVMRCESIDKVALPNLLSLLSRKSIFELVQEVLALPLPTQRDWEDRCAREIKRMQSMHA